MEAKWIRFDLQPKKADAKTQVYNVANKENGSYIGQVKWNSGWRKYCFFPQPNCLFESDCLSDIVKFLNKLMLDRKIKKQSVSSKYI